jgi:hypothetical protein
MGHASDRVSQLPLTGLWTSLYGHPQPPDGLEVDLGAIVD